MASIPFSLQKYPGIERQDLTQGQLGSFKFTPVDNVDNTNNWINQMPSHYAKYQPRAAQSSLRSLLNSRSGQNALQQVPLVPSPPSGSPSQKNMDRSQSSEMVRYAPSPSVMYDQHGFEHAYVPDSHPRRLPSEMNPVAAPFVPVLVGDGPDAGLNGLSISTQTMFRALETEQEAHHQTKTQLERALALIKKMEAEQAKRQEQVDSLCASVKMLGKMLERTKVSHNNHMPTKAGSRVATKQNAGPDSASPNEVNHSASKDLLDFDEDEIFVSETNDMEEPNQTADQCTREASNKGLGFATSAEDFSQARKTSLLASKHADPQYYNHFRHHLADKPVLALPPALLAKYQSPKTESNVTRKDKIERGIAVTSKPVTGIKVAEVLPPFADSINPLIKQQDNDKQAEHHSGAIACQDAESSNMTSVSTEKETSTTPRSPNTSPVINSLGPLKMNIRWEVTPENPVYNEGEKEKYLWRERALANLKPLFWQHPVRFMDEVERNVFRTVMIDFIPIGATYADILARIRGGAVEKIQLVGPISSTVEYMTARIVFHSEQAASKVASYARDHGMRILGKPVRVWQVITQTYPKTAQLAHDVFANMYTRLLLVNLKNANIGAEVREKMLGLLPAKLDWLQDELIAMGKTADGYDLIEFTSVQAATMAMEQLRRDEDFVGIELDFEDDPCAQSYPFGG